MKPDNDDRHPLKSGVTSIRQSSKVPLQSQITLYNIDLQRIRASLLFLVHLAEPSIPLSQRLHQTLQQSESGLWSRHDI